MATTQVRVIHSRQNSRVKELRAALLRPARAGGLIGLEGLHLIQEALASGVSIETLFVESGKERLLDDLRLPSTIEVMALSSDVLNSVVSTESPQPLAALARAPEFSLGDVFSSTGQVPLVLVSAGLQDPGNLGTLVRSAEAFGATGMVLLAGSAGVWNAKTLRASSGSAFRLPVAHADNAALLQAVHSRGVPLLAAVAHPIPLTPSLAQPMPDLRGPLAILIGNEGAGLSQVWIGAADACITIPYPGPTESLNAAVAGSILLYEAARQRALFADSSRS